jgi:hypothetical protein
MLLASPWAVIGSCPCDPPLILFSSNTPLSCSFKWIPQDLRILAGNLVGIGWGTFVSVSCINNAGGTPTAPAVCPTVAAALEAVPAACPTVMAAVEAAALGPQ